MAKLHPTMLWAQRKDKVRSSVIANDLPLIFLVVSKFVISPSPSIYLAMLIS
jgi:hypothetical protein